MEISVMILNGGALLPAQCSWLRICCNYISLLILDSPFQCMEHYYPYILNLIYIFEMPWLMNAGFKVKTQNHKYYQPHCWNWWSKEILTINFKAVAKEPISCHIAISNFFQIVKQALPAAGVARLRDVTKKDFGKFVDDDNRWHCHDVDDNRWCWFYDAR